MLPITVSSLWRLCLGLRPLFQSYGTFPVRTLCGCMKYLGPYDLKIYSGLHLPYESFLPNLHVLLLSLHVTYTRPMCYSVMLNFTNRL